MAATFKASALSMKNDPNHSKTFKHAKTRRRWKMACLLLVSHLHCYMLVLPCPVLFSVFIFQLKIIDSFFKHNRFYFLFTVFSFTCGSFLFFFSSCIIIIQMIATYLSLFISFALSFRRFLLHCQRHVSTPGRFSPDGHDECYRNSRNGQASNNNKIKTNTQRSRFKRLI